MPLVPASPGNFPGLWTKYKSRPSATSQNQSKNETNRKINPPAMLPKTLILEPLIPLEDYVQRFSVKNEYNL